MQKTTRHAADVDAAVFLAFAAQLDDAARAGFGAGAAGGALVGVDHWHPVGAHVDGVELAGGHAVAAAEASEGASALAGVDGILEGARAQAVVVGAALLAAVGGVAAHHGHHRGNFCHLPAAE